MGIFKGLCIVLVFVSAFPYSCIPAGMILHKLLHGQLPTFVDGHSSLASLTKRLEKMAKAGYRREPVDNSLGQALLSGLLESNPQKRLTAEQAVDVAWQWVKSVDGLHEPTQAAQLAPCWEVCESVVCEATANKCFVNKHGSPQCVANPSV